MESKKKLHYYMLARIVLTALLMITFLGLLAMCLVQLAVCSAMHNGFGTAAFGVLAGFAIIGITATMQGVINKINR